MSVSELFQLKLNLQNRGVLLRRNKSIHMWQSAKPNGSIFPADLLLLKGLSDIQFLMKWFTEDKYFWSYLFYQPGRTHV